MNYKNIDCECMNINEISNILSILYTLLNYNNVDTHENNKNWIIDNLKIQTLRKNKGQRFKPPISLYLLPTFLIFLIFTTVYLVEFNGIIYSIISLFLLIPMFIFSAKLSETINVIFKQSWIERSLFYDKIDAYIDMIYFSCDYWHRLELGDSKSGLIQKILNRTKFFSFSAKKARAKIEIHKNESTYSQKNMVKQLSAHIISELWELMLATTDYDYELAKKIFINQKPRNLDNVKITFNPNTDYKGITKNIISELITFCICKTGVNVNRFLKLFDEVAYANDSKIDKYGRPFSFDSKTGKIGKPSNFIPPDLFSLDEELGWITYLPGYKSPTLKIS